MRSVLPVALLLGLAPIPAGAQSVIQPVDGGKAPNAQAAERSTGPNARAAQKPLGPNGTLALGIKVIGGDVHYPGCAAAGAVRATPIRRGEAGYGRHLDRDGDGIACD